MLDKNILASTVIPRNPEREQYSKRRYLMACKCPACAAIFLIKFPNKYTYKMTGMYRTNCPYCGNIYDWVCYEIFGFQYKWIRFWRGLRRKEINQ